MLDMAFSQDGQEMAVRLFFALIAGMIIGSERSFHGRPAGFRTHALVCLASSLLMLVTVYQAYWGRAHSDIIRLDPTRMAQGIMTGVGFLGAGVIMKEGYSVRGLTTAASIWITAGIGILSGIGFYFPMLISTVLTIVILAVFRWIEVRMPNQIFYHFNIQFKNSLGLSDEELQAFIKSYGFVIADFTYQMKNSDSPKIQSTRRHAMVLWTTNKESIKKFAKELMDMKEVYAFKIVPLND